MYLYFGNNDVDEIKVDIEDVTDTENSNLKPFFLSSITDLEVLDSDFVINSLYNQMGKDI